MLKKLSILVLALAMLCSACAPKSGSVSIDNAKSGLAGLSKGDIAIIYTNDIHCGISLVRNDKGELTNFGYAEVAGVADAAAEAIGADIGADYVTLVDAGDSLQGDAVCSLSQGRYIVDIMNAVGYDVVVPGNHEFDYGMAPMQDMMSRMQGEVVSANFIDLKTGKPVYKPYTLVHYGDKVVAFVGITTPEAFSKSTPTYFQDNSGNFIYSLAEGREGAELYAAVQTAVDEASKQADYVIAIGHLGMDSVSAPWRSIDLIANTRGIDAFIDGHSHNTVEAEYMPNADGKQVLLTQTGTKLDNIGLLTISAQGTISSKLISEAVETDAAVKAFVDDITDKFEADLAKVVAHSDVDLVVNDPAATGTRIIRNRETNLGDLTADAYRFVLGNGKGKAADIGFVNGGGIRAAVTAGEISFGEVIAVHPFNNVGMVVEATGQEILDALEMSARALPGENGGFLHVSGISFTIDTKVTSTVNTDDHGGFVAVSGARRVKDVLIGGKPINPKATYTVASHNYMLMDGGDGINMFRNNKIVVQPVILDNQILIKYIQEQLKGVVGKEYTSPYGQGRIVIR